MVTRVTRLGVLLAFFTVVSWASAASAAVSAQDESRITLDLKDANIDDALRLIFRPPNSFTLEPGVTGRVTVSLHDVTFSQALRAVLDMNRLTYRKEAGNVYVITKRAEQPQATTTPPAQVEAPAAEYPLFWIGAGGRYQLQALDARDVAMWFGFGSSVINPLPIPYAAGTPSGAGGTGGAGGGFGGLGGGGLGGLGGGGLGGGGLGGLGSGGLGGGGLSGGGLGTGGTGSGGTYAGRNMAGSGK